MKIIIGLFTLLLFSSVTHGQPKPWPAMEEFHQVMSACFHPAEENNLQPLKDSVSSLYAKAKSWKASGVPYGYDADAAKPILARLLNQCKQLRKSVKKKKSDALLKEQITTAHETFHEIMEKSEVKNQ